MCWFTDPQHGSHAAGRAQLRRKPLALLQRGRCTNQEALLHLQTLWGAAAVGSGVRWELSWGQLLLQWCPPGKGMQGLKNPISLSHHFTSQHTSGRSSVFLTQSTFSLCVHTLIKKTREMP